MKNTKLLIILIIIALLIVSPVKGIDSNPSTQFTPPVIEAKELDPKAKILASYLSQYGSPLTYHAQDFIDAADEYGVDWKLVPSIAGVESTFGKHSYGYNAWGWGIYGDQTLDFASWRTGIFTVTGGLKENYINKGLTNPYLMNRVYAASRTWGAHVTYFMEDLEDFEQNYDSQPKVASSLTKTAGASAQLTFN